MLAFCPGQEDCTPARRSRLFGRQTPSITPGSTPTFISGTTDGSSPTALATSAQGGSQTSPTQRADATATAATSDPTNGDQAQDAGTSASNGTASGQSDTSQDTSNATNSGGQATQGPTSPTSPSTSPPPTDISSYITPNITPYFTADLSSYVPPNVSAHISAHISSYISSDFSSDLPAHFTTNFTTNFASYFATHLTSDFASYFSSDFAALIDTRLCTTVIDGQTSTIFSAIPTTLSPNSTADGTSSTKRDIIAGSVGGGVFLILVAAVFLFYRRHQSKKLSFFKRLQPKPRTRLLDGEDMDDYEIGPPMARYSDYPASVSSHTPSASQSHNHSTPTRSPNAPSFNASLLGSPMDPNRTPTPGGAAATAGTMPHILGMRAETGSLFREAVWPPPGQPSTLVDPLVNGSSTVDLGRIVDDVMGPGAGAAGAHPPSAFRGAGGAGASSTTLVPDDPFASLASLNTAAQAQAQYPGPPSAMHSRETSETPLLPKSSPGFFDRVRGRGGGGASPEPPGSPVPMPKMGPLFVTNMGPLSPVDTLPPGSPPLPATQSRNWLERSPKKMVRASLDRERDPGVPDIDVTEASSAGHGVGEAM
ncbi:hypothetical protein TRAPUB_10640 [Trametes pubescens]|uniref:Uncharacterized protein n=1 Tax=Trametes pubescens TaxID=154538 RepID=A0A1M2VYX7_TRAPU|nr:hypothetical protein TRAPUB_10640 [Trametes pubescens]